MLPCVGPSAERIPEKSIAVGKRKWIRQSATAGTRPDLSARCTCQFGCDTHPKKEKEGTSAHRTAPVTTVRGAQGQPQGLRLAGSAVGGSGIIGRE